MKIIEEDERKKDTNTNTVVVLKIIPSKSIA